MTSAEEWPIVERSDAVAGLRSGLRRRPARMQLLVGPPGVGKSVLARQAARASGRPRVVEALALTELADVPLGAFAPELAGRDPDPARALPALLTAIGNAADEIVLLVDDAPRLDAISAAAVYQIVRGLGVATVATGRSGEPLPQPIARLEDEGLLDAYPLGGLPLEGVAELLERRFGARPAIGELAAITERTDGNPLYLRQLIEVGGLDAIRLATAPAPARLADAVRARLDLLASAELEVLRLVALMQPAAPSNFIAAEADALDALHRQGWIVRDADARVRVAHPLYAELLADGAAAAPSRAEAQRRLLGSETPRDRLLGVAIAPDQLVAVERIVWAAEFAYASGDLAVARRLGAIAGDREAEGASAFRARLTVASAASAAGDLDAADRAFAAADGLAVDPAQRALLAGRRGEHLAYRRFDVRAAIEQAEAIRSELPQEFAASLDAELRLWRSVRGELGSAYVDSPTAEPGVALRAAMAAVMTESMRGSTAGAREAATLLGDLNERFGVLEAPAAAMLGHQRYFELLSAGAGEAASEFVIAQRAQPVTPAVGIWTYTLGVHRMYNGRLGEAAGLAALAVEQLRWRDGIGLLAAAVALEACIAAQLGRVDEAERRLDALEPDQRAEPKAAMLLAETAAWIDVRRGRPQVAVATIEAAAEAAIGVEFHLVAAISLGLCIRLGRVERATDLLDRIVAEVAPGLGFYTALRDLAAGVRDREPAAVAGAAGRVAAAGMAPTALDAIALARGFRRSAEMDRRLALVAAAISADVDAPRLQGDGDAPTLSARELEIANLAAARSRSREIAARLDISVRTVDNHLRSIYRKLSVRSRDELAGALADADAD